MLIFKEIKPFFRYDPHKKKGAGGYAMRKLAAVFFLLSGFLSLSHASQLVLNSSSVVNGVLAPTKNIDLDLNANSVDAVSVQVVYSSANAGTVTFSDGLISTGNIRIAQLSSLATAYATNKVTVTQAAAVKASVRITVVSTTSLTGTTLVLGPNTFTANTDWPTDGQTTTVAAKNLAAVIQGYSIYTATNVANVVYATATTAGIAANSFRVVSSAPALLSTSAVTFTDGLDKSLSGQTITIGIGGVSYVVQEGVQWSQLDVASNTAVSLCTALSNNFGTLFTSTVQPTSAVIYSTAVATGSGPNAWTVASSTVAMTVNSATFAGGQDAATIKIGNVTLTANRDFMITASTITTAINLANAITTSTLQGVMIATPGFNGSVVYASSTLVGAWTNFALVSSTPTALVISGSFMTGGADSDISYSTYYTAYQNELRGFFGQTYASPNIRNLTASTINKAQTSWGTALPVRVAATAGSLPSGLTATVTYYASNLGTSSFQLSDTSTGAVAGLFVTLSTSGMVGGGTLTATPIVLSGSPSFKLQMSDDGTNFQDVFISTHNLLAPFTSSTTFASPYVATNVLWNLGNVYYKVLRLVYTASTWGATNLKWIVNGKRLTDQ